MEHSEVVRKGMRLLAEGVDFDSALKWATKFLKGQYRVRTADMDVIRRVRALAEYLGAVVEEFNDGEFTVLKFHSSSRQ